MSPQSSPYSEEPLASEDPIATPFRISSRIQTRSRVVSSHVPKGLEAIRISRCRRIIDRYHLRISVDSDHIPVALACGSKSQRRLSCLHIKNTAIKWKRESPRGAIVDSPCNEIGLRHDTE